jgi:hypothetical protein
MQTYTREQMGITIFVGLTAITALMQGSYGFVGILVALAVVYLIE